MDLNYLAFFLISFIPLLIALYWYHPNSFPSKWSGQSFKALTKLSALQFVWFFILCFTIVYGYINLVIHQMGFYELFFTDIMQGNEASKLVVDEFLAKYGDKHRHFGHGVFHGAINAFVFALPFIGILTLTERKGRKYLFYHFSYWLVTSILVCGLISEFV